MSEETKRRLKFVLRRVGFGLRINRNLYIITYRGRDRVAFWAARKAVRYLARQYRLIQRRKEQLQERKSLPATVKYNLKQIIFAEAMAEYHEAFKMLAKV